MGRMAPIRSIAATTATATATTTATITQTRPRCRSMLCLAGLLVLAQCATMTSATSNPTCDAGVQSTALAGTIAVAINETALDLTDPVVVAAFEQAFVDAYNEANYLNDDLCDPYHHTLSGATLDTSGSPTRRHQRYRQMMMASDANHQDAPFRGASSFLPALNMGSFFSSGKTSDSDQHASLRRATQQQELQINERNLMYGYYSTYYYNIYFLYFTGYCFSCSSIGSLFTNDITFTVVRNLAQSTNGCTCATNIPNIRTPTAKEVLDILEAKDDSYVLDETECGEVEEVPCSSQEKTFETEITIRLEIEDPNDSEVNGIIEACVVEAYNWAGFDLCDRKFRGLEDATVTDIETVDAAMWIRDVTIDLEGECRACSDDPLIFTDPNNVLDDDWTYDDDWTDDDDGDDDSTRKQMRKRNLLTRSLGNRNGKPKRRKKHGNRGLINGDTCYCYWEVIDKPAYDRAQTVDEFLCALDDCLDDIDDIQVH